MKSLTISLPAFVAGIALVLRSTIIDPSNLISRFLDRFAHRCSTSYWARPAPFSRLARKRAIDVILAHFLWFTALTACSPHKVSHNPAPPIEMPAAYQAATAKSELPDKWWEDFGDPTLNRLIDEALAGNLQVRGGWERLTQASAMATQASSGRFPQLTASLAGGQQQNRNPLSDFAGAAPGGAEQPATYRINSFSAALAASYEVDVFQKMSNQSSAAWLEVAAARDQIEAVAITLTAQITETWFGLIAQRARLNLLGEQIEVSENFLELAEIRQGQGLGSALDVLQQRQQLAAVKARLPLVESAIAIMENQLAVLTGKTPGSIELAVHSTMPALPPRPGTGIPADLLARRPDVRAARRRVEAADYRVAVAVANRLPGLRLSGTLGLQSTKLSDLITTPVWSVLGSIFAPIFDAGRLKAEVSRNQALVREYSYNYGQVLLQAMLEVENSMIQESKQLEYIVALELQSEIATATLTEARHRYRDGLGNQSFLQILTALGGQQQVEMALLDAHQQVLSHRIQLCRALGGTWTQKLEPTTAKRSNESTNRQKPQGSQL